MDGTEPSDDFKKGGGLAASPFFALYKPTFTLSVLGVFGLALVEGIVVVRGEVEPIFLLMSLSGALSRLQGSVVTYIRTDSLLLIPVNQLRGIVSIKYTPPSGALSN